MSEPLPRHFVWFDGDFSTVAECDSRQQAKQLYDAHLAKGADVVRSACIYRADSLEQLRAHVEKRVQVVMAGVPRDYWQSERGREQQARREALTHRCRCHEELEEDMTYCPNCGRELTYEDAEAFDRIEEVRRANRAAA